MFLYSHHLIIPGSAAAWAQRRFFGAVIPAGSWFATLQSASIVGVGWKAGAAIGAGIGAAIGAGVGLGVKFIGGLFSSGDR